GGLGCAPGMLRPTRLGRGAPRPRPPPPPPPLAPLALGQHARASLERRIHVEHVATSDPRAEHHGCHGGLLLPHDELRPRPLTCGLGGRGFTPGRKCESPPRPFEGAPFPLR